MRSNGIEGPKVVYLAVRRAKRIRCVCYQVQYRTLQIVTLSEGVKMQKLLVSTMETKSFYPFVITNL
jgi:hypothetical protein